jgi:hypothetical protein
MENVSTYSLVPEHHARLDIWKFKIRLIRKKEKGWAININADLKKEKQELLKEHETLDLKLENMEISEAERQRMTEIVKDLEAIWRMEEIKVKQRSREINTVLSNYYIKSYLQV